MEIFEYATLVLRFKRESIDTKRAFAVRTVYKSNGADPGTPQTDPIDLDKVF